MISADFEITLGKIKESQDEIKNLGKEICDLKSSFEFTKNMLEEKVKKLEEWCENLEKELQEFYNNQIDSGFVYNKLLDVTIINGIHICSEINTVSNTNLIRF